jgi:hypothetical protein
MADLRLETISDFVSFCVETLAIDDQPEISLIEDTEWARNRKSFGEYTPQNNLIQVYIANRNMADILRTVCHELVHHKQNEIGILSPDSGKTGSPIENQANSIAGVILREYGKMNQMIYEGTSLEFKNLITEGIQKYKIYCDMDGVLCDFESQFEHYFGTSVKEYESQKGEKALENAINSAGLVFWSRMPWTPGGKSLWDKIGSFQVTILSAPGKFKYAKEGKKIWIREHLRPQPTKIIFRESGLKHTILSNKTPEEISKSVLIDDYGKNLTPWQQAGGKIVKYDSYDSANAQMHKL